MNPKVALVLPPYRRWYETALLSSKSGADFTLICRTRDEFYGDPKCRFRFLQPFEIPTFPSWLPPRSSARPAFYRGLTQEQLEEFDAFIESNPIAKRIQLNPVNRFLHPSIKVMASHPIHGTGV